MQETFFFTFFKLTYRFPCTVVGEFPSGLPYIFHSSNLCAVHGTTRCIQIHCLLFYYVCSFVFCLSLSNTLGGVVQPTRPPSFYGSKRNTATLYRCRYLRHMSDLAICATQVRKQDGIHVVVFWSSKYGLFIFGIRAIEIKEFT